jgi:hypothetical protein
LSSHTAIRIVRMPQTMSSTTTSFAPKGLAVAVRVAVAGP